MRNLCALLLAALSIHPLTAQTPKPTMTSKAAATPAAVHQSSIVIDTHADTTQRLLDEHYDLTQPLNGGHLNFDAAKRGNLGAEFFSIWVEPELYQGQYAHRTLALIDAVYQQAAAHPDRMRMAFSPKDIQAAHREHKLASLMGIEGGHSIEGDLGLLRDYYRLGVRYMTLTWSNSNGWADSSGDVNDPRVQHTTEGLSEFGKDVVYEMNRLGMMVDVSHVSDKTFYRTLVVTRAPVIASHSSARAPCNAPRNMTDDMLRAVARNGGVVMVNFYSAFLSEDYRKTWEALASERKKAEQAVIDKAKQEGKQPEYAQIHAVDLQFAAKIPRPPFSILIDHIDHIAKVAGVDHVGLGSDFDGIPSMPEGMDSAADLPKITEALMARGYSAADMHKILGGNLLRVFGEVEQVSHQLQSSNATARPRLSDKQPFDKPVKN